MSSWIKLDQSFSKLERRNNRNKRIQDNNVCANIEDDSSQEDCDLSSSSPTKKRKLKPLENLTIENQVDSSDESCEVDYNPDEIQLPNAKKRKEKPKLPMISSTALLHKSPTTSHSTNTTITQPWKACVTVPKSGDAFDLTSKIEDTPTDSDESSSADTVIDESSTDSSLMTSQITQQQETKIDTQESITPPVAPFILTTTKLPKKRKVRVVKGGMVEQLKKSMSKAKSNLLFWHNHRSVELIANFSKCIKRS